MQFLEGGGGGGHLPQMPHPGSAIAVCGCVIVFSICVTGEEGSRSLYVCQGACMFGSMLLHPCHGLVTHHFIVSNGTTPYPCFSD